MPATAKKQNKKIDKLNSRLKRRPPPSVDYATGLSAGACVLNLALTGRPDVGWLPGSFYLLVGDSASGKTWITHAALAEAAINRKYDKHQLVFDNIENGALMDVQKFFGPALFNRIAPPFYDGTRPGRSQKAEELYWNIEKVLKVGPAIYIPDSLDALTSEPEMKKFHSNKKAVEDGEQQKGSYGDGKAKINSSGIRVTRNLLEDTGSIVIAVSQTRDNIDKFTSRFKPKTRSGGNAPTFYAGSEVWTSIRQKLYDTVRGKRVQVGIVCRARIEKSRATGRLLEVEFPIYWSSGIGDVGACVMFLLEWRHWKLVGGKEEGGDEERKDGSDIRKKVIDAPEFRFKGKAEALIRLIGGDAAKTALLHPITAKTWKDVEAEAAVPRKIKYQQTEAPKVEATEESLELE